MIWWWWIVPAVVGLIGVILLIRGLMALFRGRVFSGLLVGVGVRMGNGCTSGHGVCGLSRLSIRSLANVLAFMAAGFVTVFVMRHLGA